MRLILKVPLLIIAALVTLNIFLSSWWLLNNDFYINFDISRDLILLHDILDGNYITLIGPHSGTVPGLFHGPAWYYFSLPALVLGYGNPVFLGWFWLALSILLLLIVYFTALKSFDHTTAIWSCLIFSANSIANAINDEKYFYNPYGAVLLSPIFFLLFRLYIKKLKLIYLFGLVFILGLLVQFQMAFGIPVLILSFLYLSVHNYFKKKLSHLAVFAVIILPLSTFILFEIRNDFLQLKTVMNYISASKEFYSPGSFVLSRFDQLLLDNFRMLLGNNVFLQLIFSGCFFGLLFYQLSKLRFKSDNFIVIFSYFYFGFGIITFLFKGEIVNYYWPFLPVVIIVFCELLKLFPKYIGIIIAVILIVLNIYNGTKLITDYSMDEQGFASWKYNLRMATFIYSDSSEDFGYFIYKPNMFGFSQRYAMEYTNRLYGHSSFPFTKKPLTYLIIIEDAKFATDSKVNGWKISDVKISVSPEKVYQFKDYRIERYRLSDRELKIEANPNLMLLNSGYFR